jgi:hypothetical protein
MKREFIVLLLLILLVSPVILAVEENIKEKTNILETNVTTPSFNFLYLIDVPSYKFNLTWVQLTIYIVAAIFLFIFALQILSFTSFETTWVKALIAGAITVLMGIFGILQILVDFFYHTLDNFKLIAWGIVIIIVASLLIKPIMEGIKKNKRLSKAEELGITAGAALKGLKKTTETAAKS